MGRSSTARYGKQSENARTSSKKGGHAAPAEVECVVCRERFKSFGDNIPICSFECQETVDTLRESSCQEYNHCDVCGDLFFYYESRHPGRGFCSRECYTKPKTEDCEECGDEFTYKGPDRKFCSRNCFTNWYSGERNHFYVNGNKIDKFGHGWRGIRKEILDRDKEQCVICGTGSNLQVHHIIPRRVFIESDEKSIDDANYHNNLVTLCVTHHMEVEYGETALPPEYRMDL